MELFQEREQRLQPVFSLKTTVLQSFEKRKKKKPKALLVVQRGGQQVPGVAH